MKNHVRYIIFIILFSTCLIVFGNSVCSAKSQGVTAIIGALPAEVEMLTRDTKDQKSTALGGITIVQGMLSGQKIIIARCGEGKVNAAMLTTLLIDHLHPARIIFTGIAGGTSPEHGPGDIIIGARVAEHDFGIITSKGFRNNPTENAVTGKDNPLFFPANPGLLQAAIRAAKNLHLRPVNAGRIHRKPSITVGTIVTGDQFIASSAKTRELREKFHADAVEMEGGAVAQVCYSQHVPCLIIRSLSDSADENAKIDIKALFQVAADNSAMFVKAILKNIL
jgi:adenosylhomocysteine nucleosidase